MFDPDDKDYKYWMRHYINPLIAKMRPKKMETTKMAKIHIPENLGSELRVLPEGPAEATLQDIFLGTSKKGLPKVTFKWVITSELFDGENDTSIGDAVLDIFSLSENAIWRLNQVYEAATDERLPMGDFEPDEFLQMLKKDLVGLDANLILTTDLVDGNERTKIDKVEFK